MYEAIGLAAPGKGREERKIDVTHYCMKLEDGDRKSISRSAIHSRRVQRSVIKATAPQLTASSRQPLLEGA